MTVSKSIKVKQGSKLEWFVRASNFEEQSGVIDVVTENISLPIYLIGNTNNTATLSFNHTPEDATVTINDVVGNNQKIRKGLTATWEVSANRYYSQSGTTDRLYDNLEIPIDLVGPHIILSIKTNKDVYTVKINGVEGNNQWVLKGTKATYSVELYGYETISGTTDELYEDTTLDFTMRKAPYDLMSTAEWTASGDKSGFSISSSKEFNINWTMTPTKRAMLSYAYVQTSYWNSDYYGRIDIHFKDGSSWLSDSQGSSTPTKSNTTYPSFTSSYNGGTGMRYRNYYQSGTCNPLKELSYLSFHHWHFSSSADVSTSAYISKLTGYWANTLILNTNVPATITIDGIVYMDVSSIEYCALVDEYNDTREIPYLIEAEGYMPQTGTIVVNEDKVLDIVLEEAVSLTINPNPADAKVVINGIEQNNITVAKGSNIQYTLSRFGYNDTIGEISSLDEDTTTDITLNVWDEWRQSTSCANDNVTVNRSDKTTSYSMDIPWANGYNRTISCSAYYWWDRFPGFDETGDTSRYIQITLPMEIPLAKVEYIFCGGNTSYYYNLYFYDANGNKVTSLNRQAPLYWDGDDYNGSIAYNRYVSTLNVNRMVKTIRFSPATGYAGPYMGAIRLFTVAETL